MSAVGRAAFSVEPVETLPQRIRGNVAALDVLDREPLPANHPLCSAPNVVMAPHLGCGLQEIRAGFYPQSCRTRWRSWTARRCGSPSLGRWGRWVSTAASAALRG
ncbi:MAG: NAD(P)-dependent oxidoreductase [Acetobacteraceae bacterium]